MSYEEKINDDKKVSEILAEKDASLEKYGTGEPFSAKKLDENTTVVYNGNGMPYVKTFLEEYNSERGEYPRIHHVFNNFQGIQEHGWYINIEAHDFIFKDKTEESSYSGHAIDKDGNPLDVFYEYPPVDPTVDFYAMLKQAQLTTVEKVKNEINNISEEIFTSDEKTKV